MSKGKGVLTLTAVVYAVLLAPPARGQTTRYVDDDAPLGGDGLTWPTAYRYLQDALAAAIAGDEIHVAAGIYRPDQDEAGSATPGNREATFQLVNGVALRGGYRGCPGGDCSGDPDERDIETHETVLSGDLAGDDADVASPWKLQIEPTRAENSLHVVTCDGTDETTLLDGFTLTSGNADGWFSDYQGGGMYNAPRTNPTVMNCTFTRNWAGVGSGMYNDDSSPTVTNCVFSYNAAESGAGMYNLNGNPVLTDCTFVENQARYYGGGMVTWYESYPVLTNCKFLRNSAYYDGGGLYNRHFSYVRLTNCTLSENSAQHDGGGLFNRDSSYVRLTNCTLTGNTATDGRALGCDSSSGQSPSTVEMVNCILWDGGDEIWKGDDSTIKVTFSDVQGGWPNDNCPAEHPTCNVDEDPLFVPGPEGCFYLSQTAAGQAGQSPCVDAGSDTAANLELDTMTTRSDEGTDTGAVDMGHHYPVTGKPLIMGDYDRDGKLDLADVSRLQACFTGPGPADVSPCCRTFDFGAPDADVDEDDYVAFHAGISGP